MDVLIADTTMPGQETARRLLEGVPSPVTLRELIRFRVREEVARINAKAAPRFLGLVQPVEREAVLNGYAEQAPALDWQSQAARAVEAFEGNGFFVLVGDRRVDDLDEILAIAHTDVVRFVRLIALVGG